MAEAALLVLVGLFAVALPLVLYALVRGERDQWEAMDRRAAERTARRDGSDRE